MRESEVQELDAGFRQHDVAGLQIAVHDAAAVRGIQRLGDLPPQPQDLIERQRPEGELRRQSLAVEVFHDQYAPAVVADVVNRADVRMGKLRKRPDLPLEALVQLGEEATPSGRTLIATSRSSRESRAR